jgi:hypothetical protein
VSIAGVSSTVDILPVGQPWRMADGGGGKMQCGEVASVKTFYSPRVDAAVNLGIGAAGGGAESMAS